MQRTPRRSDGAATLVALLLLFSSHLAGLLSNNVPQLLPPGITAQPTRVFFGAVALVLVLTLVLVVLQSKSDDAQLSRRRRRIILAVRLSQAVLAAFAGVVSNLVAVTFPPSLQAFGPWLLVAGLAVVLLLPFVVEVVSARAGLAKSDRATFLRQLTRAYEAYLDDPLQRAVRAALGLVETPAALSRPQVMVVRTEPVDSADDQGVPDLGQLPAVLAPTDTLIAVYAAAGGHLLILGAPGAGKSTQLHELGLALVTQAIKDPAAPLPVILDLSTWAANHDPLERWLVDEIVRAYRVRKDIAAQWLETKQIAPLLDALDVMAEADRLRCVQAINAYRAAYPAVPLVVCSRRDEYQQLATPLGLQRAVTLQLLSVEAIAAALESGGARLATLQMVVAQDADLRDALRTPLILNLVVLTYSDLRGDEIPRVTDLPTWRQELFSRYVERALAHRVGTEVHPVHYAEETFQQSLAWLGHALREHHEDTFYLERLQEDWLPNAAAQRRYRWLSRLVVVLGGGLVAGLVAGLALGLAVGPGLGLVGRLSLGLVVGLAAGLVVGLALGLALDSGPIEPVALLSWSWGQFGGSMERRLVPVLVPLLVVVLAIGLFFGPGVGLVAGLVVGLAVGLGGGLRDLRVDEQYFRQPNEGIRRSAQYGLFVALAIGLFFGPGVGLGLGLVVGPGLGLVGGLSIGLFFGPVFGLVAGLSLGGDAAVRHAVLRYVLRQSGAAPRHLVRFLDQATARVLLRRVGGGYQFIHQLLRDYFADQYAPLVTRDGIALTNAS